MSQDYYNFIVSPENVKSDLSVVRYNGIPVGVYSSMTQVVSGSTGGTSLMSFKNSWNYLFIRLLGVTELQNK